MQQPTLYVKNGFKILYYNARIILPKFEELMLICASESPDIVCLVETWLDGDIDDSELGIPSYSVIFDLTTTGMVEVLLCSYVIPSVIMLLSVALVV